jgi:hypothetical protein
MPGNSPKFEVYNGRTPHRPHVTPIAFNFSSGQTQLSQTLSLKDLGMEGAQSALLDNSASAYPTIFNFPGIDQFIQVAAQTQQIVPVFPTSGLLTIVVQLQQAQTCEIDVNLFDCYLPPASWLAGVISQSGQMLSLTLLTSGSLWQVPANWNSAANWIYGWGAGGNGQIGGGGGGAGGGGGGGYGEVDNSILTAGASIPYQIGLNGGTTGAGTTPTANTWFNAGSFLVAAGGASASPATGAHGAGGLNANCVGAAATNGGGAGVNGTSSRGGGGGGAGSAAAVGGDGAGFVGGSSGDGLAASSQQAASGNPGTATQGYGAGTGGNGSDVTGVSGGAGGLYGGGAGGSKNGGSLAYGSPGAILIAWLHN